MHDQLDRETLRRKLLIEILDVIEHTTLDFFITKIQM